MTLSSQHIFFNIQWDNHVRYEIFLITTSTFTYPPTESTSRVMLLTPLLTTLHSPAQSCQKNNKRNLNLFAHISIAKMVQLLYVCPSGHGQLSWGSLAYQVSHSLQQVQLNKPQVGLCSRFVMESSPVKVLAKFLAFKWYCCPCVLCLGRTSYRNYTSIVQPIISMENNEFHVVEWCILILS